MQRRPPARSAVPHPATDERQRHGLRMPDCTLREVQSTSRRTNLTQYPFETYLPKSGLTSQVCRCLWRRGLDMLDCAGRPAFLSTQANGHPLPVPSYARGRSVRRNDRVPEGGWPCAGGTSVHGHPEGETRKCSRTVRSRLPVWLLWRLIRVGQGVQRRRGRWQLSGGRRSQPAPASTKAGTPRAGTALFLYITMLPRRNKNDLSKNI